MKQELSKKGKSLFEEIKRIDEQNNEYWSARELAETLDYSQYRNFKQVIEKAKEACLNSGQNAAYHFADVSNMINIGKGAVREIDDTKLSRYACYLIVQNADPAKEAIALGQTYFAVQARIQEISQLDEYNQLKTENEKRLFLRGELRRHNAQLAEAAQNAGVITAIDYAVFQNHGYKGLYGGLDAKGIHNKKGLKKNEQILDHMGSTELAANLFRATQAEEKLRRDNIKGKENANTTHYEVGKKVRKTIQDLGGTMPEDLPVEKSIKKIEQEKGKKKLKNKDDSEGIF
jgi:DNA-damage-inducible protein D